MKKSELDSVDIEIVNLLQKRGRVQLKELSAQINLSPPATASRIRRLEEEGILEGYQAQINPISLGLYTKAFILLEVAPEQKDEFYPYIRGVGNVIECNCVTGDYSMLLRCCSPTRSSWISLSVRSSGSGTRKPSLYSQPRWSTGESNCRRVWAGTATSKPFEMFPNFL